MIKTLTNILDLFKKHPYKVVILILVGIIIVQRSCTPDPCPDPVIRVDTISFTDTVYRPEPYKVVEYVKKNIHHYKVDTVIELSIVDTGAILKDYFASIIYIDTIANDSTAFITISDVISQNRIHKRSVHKRFFPTVYTIFKEKPPRTKVFAGFGINGWKDKFGISGKLLLETKKEKVYGLSYDPINGVAEVSMYWKIKLKK